LPKVSTNSFVRPKVAFSVALPRGSARLGGGRCQSLVVVLCVQEDSHLEHSRVATAHRYFFASLAIWFQE
jgi:hypothetical protein